MKIAALILGIIGGLAGLVGGILALTVGGLGGAFGAHGAHLVTHLGGWAIVFSLVGIIGGALAMGPSKIAGIMMLISAIGGLISISMFYVIAFVLLLVGGILALCSQTTKNAPIGISKLT